MQQFRLCRGKSGCYFVENITTKKQSSLRTRDEAEANCISRLLHKFFQSIGERYFRLPAQQMLDA